MSVLQVFKKNRLIGLTFCFFLTTSFSMFFCSFSLAQNTPNIYCPSQNLENQEYREKLKIKITKNKLKIKRRINRYRIRIRNIRQRHSRSKNNRQDKITDYKELIQKLKEINKNVRHLCKEKPLHGYYLYSVALNDNLHALKSKDSTSECLSYYNNKIQSSKCNLNSSQMFDLHDEREKVNVERQVFLVSPRGFSQSCFRVIATTNNYIVKSASCPQESKSTTGTPTPTSKPSATKKPTTTPTSIPTNKPTNRPTRTPLPKITLTPTANPTVEISKITLPLEVLSATVRQTESIEFDTRVKGSTIIVSCHRCAYKDASVNQERGAKVSIRVNSSQWIDVLDSKVSVFDPAKTFGGLAGGFYTVKFSIDGRNLNVGKNIILFRFNATDGHTNGFRVIDFDVQNEDSKSVLLNPIKRDNPARWKRDYPKQMINAGKELWFKEKHLDHSPVSNKVLNASCNDCHAHGGRDLQYFNYSDKSIQERSKFHGLSNEEAQNIVAFVRNIDIPVVRHARPWNPPYQPGKNIDERPAYEWAAGGGLQSVLDHDIQTIDDIFPNGTSKAELNRIISSEKTLNVREVRTVIQFPDWNAWLPDYHPKDMYTNNFYKEHIHPGYTKARSAIEDRRDELIQNGKINNIFSDLRKDILQVIKANGAQPCINSYQRNPQGLSTLQQEAVALAKDDVTCGIWSSNMHRLHSLRAWELMHEFDLEDKPSTVYRYGEKRGWLGNTRSVFEIASHRSATNNKYHTWQSKKLGAYHSNVWYQLQLVLNGGGYRERANFFPQDWFYTPNWLTKNAIEHDADLGGLMTMNELKKYQVRDARGTDGKGLGLKLGGRGWWMPFMHPYRLHSGQEKEEHLGKPWNSLNKYSPKLHGKIADAFLKEFLKVIKSIPLSELPREDYLGQDSSEAAFDSVDTNPETPSGNSRHKNSYYIRTYQSYTFFKVIPHFYEIGVSHQTMNELIDWCKLVWKKGDWEKLRR